MFQKKKPLPRATASVRKPAGTLNEAFRRNNVVLSRKQLEVEERQQSVSQRQAERARQRAWWRRKLKLAAVAVAVLLGGLLYRSNISAVHVSSNASTRLKAAGVQEYEAAVLAEYKAHTILGQSWLADTDAVTRALQDKFPEVERIAFSSVPLSTTLKADLRFRKPVFTWKDAAGSQQFVDQNGVLFSKNLEPTTDAAKLVAIEDQSGVVLKTGSAVLTTDLIRFIGQLHSKLPTLYGPGSGVGRVIIPRSTREVQLQMKGLPYVIKFNSSRKLEEQVGELNALLDHLKAQGITPASHIDLRVAHKSFYK